MSSLVLGLIIGLMCLFAILIGMPIAFALGGVAILSIVLFVGPLQFNMLADYTYESLNDFTLLAIPLFIFMGTVFARSKASDTLFEAANTFFGRIPGGLAISSVFASSLFAAISGSSPATAAAIGKAAIPEMKKRGYSEQVATGAIAAGGTLGILIPPSVVLILYGIAVEQSIGRLFLAGIVPGIIITLMFSAWIYIVVKREIRLGTNNMVSYNEVNQEVHSAKSKLMLLIQILPFITLLVIVLASLYMGIATPSEAAAVGAIAALVMIVILYRSMTWKNFWEILLDTTKESGMVLLIIAFSALIGIVMSFLSIPQDLAELVVSTNVSNWIILIIINIFLLILGLFLPPAAIILMTAPILLPIIVGLGFDPIWFGVIMTINMEVGLITPPVGLNLFVVKSISPDTSTSDIIKGAVPFVFVLLLAILLFTVFPNIVTWLPNLLMT